MPTEKIFACCHCHSTFSDGELSPEMLVQLAYNMGHGGIILTDHDTANGYPFLKKAADKYSLKTMTGCEFTTYHKGKGLHMCAFDFDPDEPEMKALLNRAASIQTARTECMFHWGLERGTLRPGCTWQDVLDDHPYHNYFCNNEVFASMMKRGIYKYEEYDDAFRLPNFSYKLGLEAKIAEVTGKSYTDITAEMIVKIVRKAGGVCVVAHPDASLAQYVDDFLSMGIMGFETRHARLYSPKYAVDGDPYFYARICEEKKLYKMGGSDHEGVLGGLLSFGAEYDCAHELSGVSEEDFMTIFERRLG